VLSSRDVAHDAAHEAGPARSEARDADDLLEPERPAVGRADPELGDARAFPARDLAAAREHAQAVLGADRPAPPGALEPTGARVAEDGRGRPTHESELQRGRVGLPDDRVDPLEALTEPSLCVLRVRARATRLAGRSIPLGFQTPRSRDVAKA